MAAGNHVDPVEFEVRELRRLVETASSDVAMRALDRIGKIRRELEAKLNTALSEIGRTKRQSAKAQDS